MATEFAFRAIVSGGLGSLTQGLRFAEPPWAALLVAVLVMATAADDRTGMRSGAKVRRWTVGLAAAALVSRPVLRSPREVWMTAE